MRFLVSLAAGIGTALVTAVALTVLDLYLTGHALGTVARPLLDLPALGVHLSIADAILLGAAALAAALTWHFRSRRGG